VAESDDGARRDRRALIPRSAFTRTREHYALAVLGYFAIGILTKTFLTFTMGLLYFILTLDVLPRIYGWLRRPRREPEAPVDAVKPGEAGPGEAGPGR
jgi:hypothetical protein